MKSYSQGCPRNLFRGEVVGAFLDYTHCEQHSALNGRKRLLTYCSKFPLQTTLIQNTQLMT